MDKTTTIHDLKEKVRKFCEDRNWDGYHGSKDLAIGIITEASELLEHFRFKTIEESEAFFEDPKKRRQIAEELVDTLFPILRFAQKYNIDLAAELSRKMRKNSRKHPVSKYAGKKRKV